MPSTMIHLQMAEKIKPNASTEYFIGNVAPDAVTVRPNHHFSHKDKLHFRNSPTRQADIENLAKDIDISNPYCEGYIMHLFLDMHWDKDCMIPFIAGRQPQEWVMPYRHEISIASAWIYDNRVSLQNIWNNMFNYDKIIDTTIQGITYDEVKQYFVTVNSWYNKYKSQPSDVFNTDFVDKYTDEIAEKYIKWVSTLKGQSV